jgi:hypothetical protein
MPSAEDLLRQMNDEPETPEDVPSDVVPEELPIEVSYRLGNGKVLSGLFVHAVPSVQDEINISRLAAAQRGGMSAAAFPPGANDLIDATSYIAVTMRHRPDWAKDVARAAMGCPDLVLKLWQEGLRHRARFLDAGSDLRPGASPA